jgi:ABC-type nitrate/sulfonate/bicarbonate transport system ATPase subunit
MIEAPVIEAVDVNHFYEGQLGWNHMLDHLSLSIRHNEFLCILGPTGCGKSTYLTIIAGLIRPSAGLVRLNDKPIKGPGLDRGVVFQDPALFAWLTVLRNVEFGLLMNGSKRHAARDRAMHVLDIVGLVKQASLYPFQLPGGMKHRVAVARAWALTDAALLLMDEPFSAIERDRSHDAAGSPGMDLADRATHGPLRHARHRGSPLSRRSHRYPEAVARTARERSAKRSAAPARPPVGGVP